MAADGPVRRTPDGVSVALRVLPRARKAAIGGVVRDAAGVAALRVSVTAPPEDGRANDAVIALLAKAWAVPKRAIALAAGARARRKTVHVAGDPAALEARILASAAHAGRKPHG